VISEGVPALTRGRISHVDQKYLRPENYTAANSVLIAQDDIALARQWGGAWWRASTGCGSSFPWAASTCAPTRSTLAAGAVRRGSACLNDQAVGLAGRVLSGIPGTRCT
jgi:hypothetical protein